MRASCSGVSVGDHNQITPYRYSFCFCVTYIRNERRTLIKGPSIEEQFCQVLNNWIWRSRGVEITLDQRKRRGRREEQEGWWRHELREHVRQRLIADVCTRATKDMLDRKDMQDLSTQCHFDARCALLLGKPYAGSKHPHWNARVDSPTPMNPPWGLENLSLLDRHRPDWCSHSCSRFKLRWFPGVS